LVSDSLSEIIDILWRFNISGLCLFAIARWNDKLWTNMGFKYLTDDVLAGFDKYRVLFSDIC